MKPLLRSAIPLFALVACATSKEVAPPAQTPAAAPAAQREAEKPSAAPPAKASVPSGPTTASEAADQVHEEWLKTHGGRRPGSGGDGPRARAEDGPWPSD